jgi:hypothetical protein
LDPDKPVKQRTQISLPATRTAPELLVQSRPPNVRLAGNSDDMKKADDYIAARLKSVGGFAAEMLKISRSPENRGRIEKIRDMASDYAKGARKIGAVRTEALDIEKKHRVGGEASPEDLAKIARLNDEAIRIARDETLPLVAELESLANTVVDFAKQRAEQENAEAAQEMSSAQRNGLALGSFATLLMIATCIFSLFSRSPGR